METWKIIFLVVYILIVIIGGILLFRHAVKKQNSMTFVYPKTGHKYFPLYRCKLKCPVTREWFDAIIYQSMEDGKYYVRERVDFLDKFVKLNDWKNGNKGK